jgi:hypothetical protein
VGARARAFLSHEILSYVLTGASFEGNSATRVCSIFFFILVHAKREKVLYRRLQKVITKSSTRVPGYYAKPHAKSGSSTST